MLINEQQVQTLMEALPYLSNFKDKTIVVKYGGNAMLNDELKNKVLQDILFLQYAGMRPVVVHGGGPEISEMLKKIGKESRFVNGLRYTDCGKPVHRVAVGGGACGDYIPQAIAAGCDTFVTSDLRYHEFLDNTELNLIDAGHFPTEDGVCAAVVDYLQKVFPAATVMKTTAHRSEVIQYCIKEK